MIKPAHFVRASLAALLIASSLTAAPVPAPADNILQQELKQQQFRSTTQRVGNQLESIIAEFERNGITGEDVKVLTAIRASWES